MFYRSFPAPEAPRHLLIFGSGAQAAAHAHLFLKLWPSCESCTIVARRSTDRVDALVSELQDAFPSVKVSLGVSTYPSAPEPSDGAFDLQSAVHNANVIITVTPSREPLFNSVDVTSNTRVVMVGSYTPDMHEVDEQLIRRAGIVVVDSREACLQEAGELIAARLRPEQMVELGEVVGAGGEGAVDLVQQNGDIVVFKSVRLQALVFLRLTSSSGRCWHSGRRHRQCHIARSRTTRSRTNHRELRLGTHTTHPHA